MFPIWVSRNSPETRCLEGDCCRHDFAFLKLGFYGKRMEKEFHGLLEGAKQEKMEDFEKKRKVENVEGKRD